jgi:cobalt-zinc-cadmium efflux system outer membrane protein
MPRPRILGAVLLTVMLGLSVRPAQAQLAQLADDLVLLTNRLRNKEAARTHQHLGPGPGSMESPFTNIPGAPQPSPSEPSRASTPGQANIMPPPALAPAPMPSPLYGVLEVPAIADEGPPDGITLDQAIERLVQANPDLLTRAQELPKAQADIVSASMRNNPFLFGNVGNVPYGSFSPQRPGNVNYEITIIQSWDVNQKRRQRIRVAQSARNVVECLYQDAVRLQIDNLYTAFLDVLAAREALRQQQVGLEGLEQIVKYTRDLFEKSGEKVRADLERVEIQEQRSQLAVEEARNTLRQAKQTLAVLLNVPPADMDCLELRGAIGGFDLELPPVDKLIETAMEMRPDLNAYRLGIHRAEAEVRMARADRWADVFLLYTPWQLQVNTPLGAQNSTSWSFGALVTLPVFNRNQGNIARAQYTVNQTLIETQGRELQVVSEVRKAYQDFVYAQSSLSRYEKDILPRARRIHEAKLKSYKAGTEGVIALFEAQREYNDVVRSYLEQAVRFRRSALRLNTAVGQRIVP